MPEKHLNTMPYIPVYMVFVWLYMEVICPNTVKFGRFLLRLVN